MTDPETTEAARTLRALADDRDDELGELRCMLEAAIADTTYFERLVKQRDETIERLEDELRQLRALFADMDALMRQKVRVIGR